MDNEKVYLTNKTDDLVIVNGKVLTKEQAEKVKQLLKVPLTEDDTTKKVYLKEGK